MGDIYIPSWFVRCTAKMLEASNTNSTKNCCMPEPNRVVGCCGFGALAPLLIIQIPQPSSANTLRCQAQATLQAQARSVSGKAWESINFIRVCLAFPTTKRRRHEHGSVIFADSSRFILSAKRPIIWFRQLGIPIAKNALQRASMEWLSNFCKCLVMWVCLKIRYIPNYSHLIGIIIINHWV